MRDALKYLAQKGVPYVPLNVEENINMSYEEDDLEAFRETVRRCWIRELMRRSVA